MNTVYLLGGPPRTAKSTIMSILLTKQHVQFTAADAIEHGLRNVLTSEPHQMLRAIEIKGKAQYKTSLTEGGKWKTFSNKGTESELTLQAIIGMLDYYRRNNESVAFEGAAISPSWAAGLNSESSIVRAAFVGYTDPSHANSIIAYAKQTPHDWINNWLQSEGGDESKIRDWVAKQAVACRALKSEAKKYGYPFFDISTTPFEEYMQNVISYLLEH